MQEYSMKETCKITGLTYNTLKFYCNEGLIPNVKRNKNNYRVFDDNNIGWIKNLLCLKKCGMSSQEIKNYMNLCMKGKESITERKIILDKKLTELEVKMKKIQESIDFINWKKKYYDDILNDKIEYHSFLKINS